MQRAVETARIIAESCDAAEPEVIEDLTEWELGSYWSGRTWGWVKRNRPREWRLYTTNPSAIDFISETLDRLSVRMHRAFRAALNRAPARDAKAIALVSHADPLKVLVLSLRGENLDRIHAVEFPLGAGMLLEARFSGESIADVEVIEQYVPSSL